MIEQEKKNYDMAYIHEGKKEMAVRLTEQKETKRGRPTESTKEAICLGACVLSVCVLFVCRWTVGTMHPRLLDCMDRDGRCFVVCGCFAQPTPHCRAAVIPSPVAHNRF